MTTTEGKLAVLRDALEKAAKFIEYQRDYSCLPWPDLRDKYGLRYHEAHKRMSELRGEASTQIKAALASTGQAEQAVIKAAVKRHEAHDTRNNTPTLDGLGHVTIEWFAACEACEAAEEAMDAAVVRLLASRGQREEEGR